MDLRQELGQMSWVARRFRDPRRFKKLWRAARGLHLPDYPRRRRVVGSVWGISMVRDELDVLPDVVDHMLEQGLERLLIADNLSTDGTYEWLQDRAAHDPRVLVARDTTVAYYQSEKMSLLAHHAWRGGADWIVPFDADEFWYARGASVADYLRTQDVGSVRADFHHMVPTTPAPADLRTAEYIMDAAPSEPGKTSARAHPILELHAGNHFVSRVGGVVNHGLFIAHAQYRSPAQVARKMRQGIEAVRLAGEDVSHFSPHWESGSKLGDDAVADVWDNISHGRADERIMFKAVGPMVTLRPLTWDTWDPAGEMPPVGDPT